MRRPRRRRWAAGRHVLAEQTRHMLPGRRQTVIQGGRNQHFHDGLLRPAAGLGIEIGLLHIGQARRDNDAGRVMIRRGLAGQAREVGQLGQGHVHAERAGAAAPMADALAEILRQRRGVDQLQVQQLRIQIGDRRCARGSSRRSP